jgi:hypothetical protein
LLFVLDEDLSVTELSRPARERRQGGSTQRFPRTQAEASMVPGTPHRVFDQEPFDEWSAIVGTGGTNSEVLIALPRNQYGILTDVADEHAPIGERVD